MSSSWWKRAACRGGPDYFHNSDATAAKRTCSTCPVRPDCLAYAVDLELREGKTMDGVWGGTTMQERAGMHPAEKRSGNMCSKRLHLMSEENLMTDRWGREFCRECRRERRAERKLA